MLTAKHNILIIEVFAALKKAPYTFQPHKPDYSSHKPDFTPSSATKKKISGLHQ